MNLLLQKPTLEFFNALGRKAYHLLFWLLLLLLLIRFEDSGLPLSSKIINESLNVLFYAAIVYYNLLYLIPHYLKNKKFGTYSVLFLTAVFILTPLKTIVFYFLLTDSPMLQGQLLENLNLYFAGTFLVGSSSTIVQIVSDWFIQLKEKQELQTQTMQSELRFLKSQINPHFLFNTLNNLYALTLKKSDKAPEIVIKLSEMMRYMLYECNEKTVPLTKEVNYLQNYLDLERLRQNDKIKIEFDVKGNPRDHVVAPLLFIPFLENSFKHGLNNQLRDGFVQIFMEILDTELNFYIENSKGEVVPRPSDRPSGGIGLENVRRRLNLLYPEKHELTIHNNPHTFAVSLQIDLK